MKRFLKELLVFILLAISAIAIFSCGANNVSKVHDPEKCSGVYETTNYPLRETSGAPTCQEVDHQVLVYCQSCDNLLEFFNINGEHVYEERVRYVAPTCESAGISETYEQCIYCDNVLGVISTATLPKTSHTAGSVKIENRTSATCGVPGKYDEVVYCRSCGTQMSRVTKTVSSLPHSPADPVIENNVNPTCSSQGSYDSVTRCSSCKTEISRETVITDALPHTPGSVIREDNSVPTCTEDGSYYEITKCSVCTSEISRSTVAIPARHELDVSGCIHCDLRFSEGLNFKLTTDRSAYEVSGIGTCIDEILVIPTSYNGLSVIGISKNAFEKSDIIGVVIFSNIRYIGESAFAGCKKLAEILNYSELKLTPSDSANGAIAENALSVETDVKTGSRLRYLNGFFFYDGESENVLVDCVLQDSMLELPDNFFGESYTIRDYAFKDDNHLIRVKIPECVTEIGSHAFSACNKLTEICNDSSAEINMDTVHVYSSNSGSSALIFLDGFIFFERGDELYLIGSESGVSTLTLPGKINGKTYKINSHAFYGSQINKINSFGAATEIGAYAFAECDSLESVTITDGLAMQIYAFKDCDNLRSVTSRSDVGMYAFYGCRSLCTITLYANVASGAFENCNNVETVFIGSGVKSIGARAFSSCAKLQISDLASWCSITFDDAAANPHKGGTVYISNVLLKDTLTIPSSVKTVTAYAFSGFTMLKKIVLSTETSTENNAFYGCTGVVSMTLGKLDVSLSNLLGSTPTNLKTVTVLSGDSLPSYAFANFTGITEITLPGTLRTINSYAFSNCTSLMKINIGSIADWCKVSISDTSKIYANDSTVLYVNGFSVVGALTIPTSVTEIGTGFRGYSNISAVTIPSSVTKMADGAFLGCTNLKKVTIPYAGTNASGSGSIPFAFERDAIETVIILGGSEIPSSYFASCTALKSVTLPSTIKTLNNYAFAYCTALSSITLPSGLEQIGTYAFNGCTALTSITIPSSVTKIQNRAFAGCNLSSVKFESKNNWSVQYGVAYTPVEINATDLSNGSTAAYYLTDKYLDYIWSKN